MNSKAASLIIFFIAFLDDLVHSQSIDYGLNLIYNSSSQTNTDPTIPEDGTSQWNSLGTWGGGIYGTYPLSAKLSLCASINYQQKGYKEIAQVGFIPGGPVDENQLENTFDYLCGDVFLRYRLFKSTTIEGLLGLGFEYGYLLDFEIESDFFPINHFYPVNEYQDNWEKHNISFIPSLSFIFNEVTTLECGFNRSITPVLETEHLIVKDWIWTVRLYQSIPGIFR